MRNLYKPNRFKVASIQAQQTMGGDVMQADEDGDYVEFRDYRRALDEIEMLKHTIKYWEIEAQTDHARWLRTLEENEKLRAEVERLTFDPMSYLDDKGEWMPRHIHLAAVERLKAEVERLTQNTDKLCKHGDLEIERLKAENERLRKAGDVVQLALWLDDDDYCKEQKEKAEKAWNAAKEGKPSV